MHDLIIIGGGPAGCSAAECAGGLGKSVLLVEKEEHLGGVCLNTGCIPTKALLHSARLYDHARHGEAFGVKASGLAFDYAVAKKRAGKVIESLREGLRAILKRNKAQAIRGEAALVGPEKVSVNGEIHEGRHILIATGARPSLPPVEGLEDNDRVLTNEGILALDKMPEELAVIGAGVIGIEFACLYAMAGSRVTVLEMLPQICGGVEPELARLLQRKLEKSGVRFHLSATVERLDGDRLHFRARGGARESLVADRILVATGRRPNVEGLGLEKAGVSFDRKGIPVNDRAETNAPGIYAAGDVTGKWLLAHFAARQARVAVRNMFGEKDFCREDTIPAVVYADPEIAGA
ncbi:MAG: NAD(P)/FAD-dependent oxidoreductase, partial [Planctomycetota bacterium]